MTQTFTPGPWNVTKAINETVRSRYIDPEVRGGNYRGMICSMTDCEHIAGITQEEMEANARLIAAAPDMYEALTDLTQLVNSLKWGQQWPGRHHALMDRVEAALAKVQS